MKKLICTFFISLFVFAIQAQLKTPEWVSNATIYEVNVRQFTPEGTFAAFEKELPRLKAMGVDILWLMPIHPIGELNRKGSLGSSMPSGITAVLTQNLALTKILVVWFLLPIN